MNNESHFWETTLAQNFEDAILRAVENWCLSTLDCLCHHFVTENSPELVDVGNRAKVLIAFQVVVTHTNFTKVTRVKLIHQGTVVMLTTSVTTSTGVGTMLTDTTVTGRDVSALFAIFMKS